MIQATKKNDEKMREMIKQIKMIKEEVRDHLLHQYITQCKKIHLIAFMQWRKHFTYLKGRKAHEEEELQEMIEDVADHINHHSQKMLEQYGMADETIMLGANPQVKNPAKIYGIQDEGHSYLVNNFE